MIWIGGNGRQRQWKAEGYLDLLEGGWVVISVREVGERGGRQGEEGVQRGLGMKNPAMRLRHI